MRGPKSVVQVFQVEKPPYVAVPALPMNQAYWFILVHTLTQACVVTGRSLYILSSIIEEPASHLSFISGSFIDGNSLSLQACSVSKCKGRRKLKRAFFLFNFGGRTPNPDSSEKMSLAFPVLADL